MRTTTTHRQPWIFSPSADLLLIAGPAFISVLGAWLLTVTGMQSVSPWGWLVLVAGIDVAHVYSTLWRTYLDPSERSKYGQLLLFIPFGAYFVGTLLYALDGILFWRTMAYLAVFHFVRQQYRDHGIGRWAVIDKKTNEFIGWTGLKFVTELTNNHHR